MANERKIALLGQPNSGKSTVFNTLTGAHQHVGNWPGKTVEKVEGEFTRNGVKYLVADLPGTYSLSANSDEEIVTRDYIASGGAELTCILADASQLERSLFMLADYAGINTPAMLVLTMTDVSKAQGKSVDAEKLSQKLGIPVVSLVAPDKKSYGSFYQALEESMKAPKRLSANVLTALYESGGQKRHMKRPFLWYPQTGSISIRRHGWRQSCWREIASWHTRCPQFPIRKLSKRFLQEIPMAAFIPVTANSPGSRTFSPAS